jgi:hypothetical protein
MKHFGRPIQDYFPWLKYNDVDIPKVDMNLFNLFKDCVPYKFSSLGTIWITNTTGCYIGLEFMISKELYYNVGSQRATLSLRGECINFDTESFLEVEKMRLTYLLGDREKAQEYITFVDSVLKFQDLIEYYQILIDDFNTGYKIKLTNLKNVSNRIDLYSKIKFTEKELTDIIRDYDGSNTFLHSLKNHLHKTGSLTYRQLNAAADKRNLKDLGVTIDEDKICIELETTPSKEVNDELRTMTNRFKLDGYKVLDCNNKTIIY